jgi:hypothetical protein
MWEYAPESRSLEAAAVRLDGHGNSRPSMPMCNAGRSSEAAARGARRSNRTLSGDDYEDELRCLSRFLKVG